MTTLFNLKMQAYKSRALLIVSGLAAVAAIGCKKQQPVSAVDTVLPGRHLSEHQVADIVNKELPANSNSQCEFKNGIWEISEVQKNAWGISSAVTNADGKIAISSTNPTHLVLRVRDADGKVERVN